MHDSELELTVIGLILLLIIAAAARGVCKRLKLPLTIVLVLIGMALAAVGRYVPDLFAPLAQLHLTPELVLFVFLPTLIFESALSLDVRQLQRNLLQVLTLAIPGLLLSTFLIGAFVTLVTPLPFTVALLLGAILSATDPVAVIALFKQLGTPGRLTVLVEGESLLNDATALVLARLLAGIVAAGALGIETVGAGVVDFFVVFFGGILVGWLVALAMSWIIGIVEGDYFIEITLTTILAYCSFIVAEVVFHVSGIMATVAAGVTLSALGRSKISPSVAEYMEHFWEYIAFLANALIFLMVGLQIDLPALWGEIDTLAWVVLAMLLSRAAVIYGLLPLVGRLPGSDKVSRAYQTVMFWGGLRGAVALAIVFSLPNFAYRDLLEILVMGAVLFTLVVQGLSIEALIQRLGLNRPPLADRLAREEGLLRAQRQLFEAIPGLEQSIHFSPQVAEMLRTECQKNINTVEADISALRLNLSPDDEYHILLSRCLAREKRSYYQMYAEGQLGERAFRELDQLVTVQINSLRFDRRLPKDSFGRWSSKRIHRQLVHVFARLPWLSGTVERMRLKRMILDYDTAWGRVQAGAMTLEALDEIAAGLLMSGDAVERIRAMLQSWHEDARQLLGEMTQQFPEFVEGMQERVGARQAALATIDALDQLVAGGSLPEAAAEPLVQQQIQQLRRLRTPLVSALSLPILDLLRENALLKELPEEEFRKLARHMHAHTIPRHEMLIHPGEVSVSLYFVARGEVAIFEQRDRTRHELVTFRAGDMFRGTQLAANPVRAAQAMVPSVIFELRGGDLEELCEMHPSISGKLEPLGDACLEPDVSRRSDQT